MTRMTVIIPVYNEEQAIRRTLDELLPAVEDQGWQLIVVNDGSEDQTGPILESFANRLKVITHPYNRGYGAALKTGIRAAETELIAIFDSDGQHRPEDLLLLYGEAGGADLVIGERAAGSRVDLFRLPGKWFLTHAANFIVGRKIPDLNSGLRIFKRVLYKKNSPSNAGRFFLYFHLDGGGHENGVHREICADPNTEKNRYEHGSPISPRFHGADAHFRLVVLFSPLRIFMPVSIALAGLGIAYAGYVIATVRLTLANGALLCLLAALMIFFFGLVVDQISVMRRERYMYED